MTEHGINVNMDGSVNFIYDDDLVPLVSIERQEKCESSHIAPAEGGSWVADLSPIGGPILYCHADGEPFRTRREAVLAEVAWLQRHGRW